MGDEHVCAHAAGDLFMHFLSLALVYHIVPGCSTAGNDALMSPAIWTGLQLRRRRRRRAPFGIPMTSHCCSIFLQVKVEMVASVLGSRRKSAVDRQ